MDERAEACRKKAMECERMAMASSDAALRFMYLDLAKQWREMAEQAEYFDRRYAVQKGPAQEIKRLERWPIPDTARLLLPFACEGGSATW